MRNLDLSNLLDHLKARARQWDVNIEQTWETASSVLASGMRRGSRVVLKILKQNSDEWRAAEVLRAFAGHGTVRVLEFDTGAILLEGLEPGNQLLKLVQLGKDEDATQILAELMLQMAHHTAPEHCPTVMDWGRGFDRFMQTDNTLIGESLIGEARDLYRGLATSQKTIMLLHGDLHHYNVLFDSRRGWVAIDPKGVLGEVEYEVGAMIRNPAEEPELFTSTRTIERRLDRLTTILKLDYGRALGWAFAQAVLSAIWDIEDGCQLGPDHHTLKLWHAQSSPCCVNMETPA